MNTEQIDFDGASSMHRWAKEKGLDMPYNTFRKTVQDEGIEFIPTGEMKILFWFEDNQYHATVVTTGM
jgi:hypothetical protein